MDYTYTFLGNDFSTAENCEKFIEATKDIQLL